MSKADVVKHDEHDVRRAVRRACRLRPPGCRLAIRPPDRAAVTRCSTVHRALLTLRSAERVPDLREAPPPPPRHPIMGPATTPDPHGIALDLLAGSPVHL